MHHRKTYMYINFFFSKIGLVDQSKLCTQIYLQKFANCINLQLAIRISKNHAFRTCTTPTRTFRPILRSIGLLDNELPRKENISTDDRRTDNRYFFSKKEKNTKNYSAKRRKHPVISSITMVNIK